METQWQKDTREAKRAKQRARVKPPVCPYCSKASVLVSDVEVYGKSYGGRMLWQCAPCNAYVGTHKGSKRFMPLGRLANKELRARKVEAHACFDPLWTAAVRLRGWTIAQARGAAYAWLAGRLGIPVEQCHIGWFDLETTERVIAECRAITHR